MARTEKRRIGDIGEEVACRFLERQGFSIIERNYLKKWGEIDIIAKQRGVLHFVEVKTLQLRSGQASPQKIFRSKAPKLGYRAEENVHPKKLQRLHRAVGTYLLEKNVSEETGWQIDVAVVYLDLDGKQASVKILENIV